MPDTSAPDTPNGMCRWRVGAGREGAAPLRPRRARSPDLQHRSSSERPALAIFAPEKLLERARGVPPIHVAQGHDVLAFELVDVARALSADADRGDVQLLIRGVGARRSGGENGERGVGASW